MKTIINGLPVEVTFSEDNINNVFIPLLRRLSKLQKEKNRRILVYLAGPPGAGKSTLAQFLSYLSHSTDGVVPITDIGMDGFHRYQDYLINHVINRDGIDIPMVKIKGAPETFDLDKLIKMVGKIASGDECSWPSYDRTTHNPKEDAVKVSGDIVLLEGNYLLLDSNGWRDLRKYADYAILLKVDENTLRKRLIERKVMCGNSRDEAEKIVDFSDMVNVKLVNTMSGHADLELSEGDFC